MTTLHAFDYDGVVLLPGRFQQQVMAACDVYGQLPNDDLLKGFRRAAGLPAPGREMGGWCTDDSAVIFGQLISGLVRMGRATGNRALMHKACALLEGWHATIAPSGDLHLGLYAWDKLVGALVDLYRYADYTPARPLLQQATEWAASAFDRSRRPASKLDWDGRHPKGTAEWYTLPENLYRAYLLTNEPLFKEFADVWLYEDYWALFEKSASPAEAHTVHAYSHVNSFNSAAMAYAVTEDPRYLRIISNAYDYLQISQCYATGGYGPVERLLPADGRLGEALELHPDDAEIPCGSWAGFKLARYLLCFTGQACYGDWIETLLYNGVGAALPTQPDGATFYYADYRLGGGEKLYFWETWPCCSGTYWQCMAEYHNLIYFKGDRQLCVNLFVPSEVRWLCGDETVTVRQETGYPEDNTTALLMTMERPTRFTLRLRVPGWCHEGFRVTVNGLPQEGIERIDGWATLEREWRTGDRVAVCVPMALRMVPVDPQHPRRVAMMYGPVVLVQDARFKRPFRLPDGLALDKRLVVDGSALRFRAVETEPQDIPTGTLQPFYATPARLPYRMYLDLDRPWIY